MISLGDGPDLRRIARQRHERRASLHGRYRLTDEPVILENIPQVRDIETTRKLLSALGAEVELGFGRAQYRPII